MVYRMLLLVRNILARGNVFQKCPASNNIIREQVKQLYQIFQSFDLKDDKSGSLVGCS